MIEQIIPTIIDKHLDKIVSRQLNALPRNIASEMRSDQVCEDEDWFFWLPIASKVMRKLPNGKIGLNTLFPKATVHF